MSIEIISETPINAYQVKEQLAKIKKRDGELNFRAQKTEEHLAAVATAKDADKLYQEIEKLGISRLRENHIHKIVDIMPETVADLKVLLQGYTVSVSQDNLKKIADLVVKHSAKK